MFAAWKVRMSLLAVGFFALHFVVNFGVVSCAFGVPIRVFFTGDFAPA